MLTLFGLLAAVDPFSPGLPEGEPSKVFGFALRDILLVVGVALVLAVVLFLWVYLTRKSRPGHADSRSRTIRRAEEPEDEESSGRMKTRKRRRRHPDNLPRNPTLGETGGLPPMRSDEPAEPTS